jgi:hypothetical protein
VDGDQDWKMRCLEWQARHGPTRNTGPFDHILRPKFSAIPRGSHLTKGSLAQMDVAELQPMDAKLLFEMLFNREAAIMFDLTEIGLFRSEV